MFANIQKFSQLIRFSHTVFALPFAVLAAIIAWAQPGSVFRWQDAIGILLCMVFARSAAMAFNRLVDRRIDKQNPRTAVRHLPAGLLSVKSVIIFTCLCCLGYFASTVLFLPKRLPIYLSAPVLIFLLSYSYTKRFTALCHYWLSAALMLSPVAAWVAVRDEFATIPWLLAGVIFFWVGGFDIIYACQDEAFDKEQRLHSIPAKFGIRSALRIAMVSHLLTIAALFGVWHFADRGWVFLLGISGISLLLMYQHWLVRPDDLGQVNTAFFHVNAIVSFGLLVIGCLDLWVGNAFKN